MMHEISYTKLRRFEERNMLCTYFILFYLLFFFIRLYIFQNPILAEKETIIILFERKSNKSLPNLNINSSHCVLNIFITIFDILHKLKIFFNYKGTVAFDSRIN